MQELAVALPMYAMWLVVRNECDRTRGNGHAVRFADHTMGEKRARRPFTKKRKLRFRMGVLGRIEIVGSDNLGDGLGIYSNGILGMGCLLDSS